MDRLIDWSLVAPTPLEGQSCKYALGDFIHMVQVSLPSISIWSLQLRHFWRQLVLFRDLI